jgi:hypothetical protein
MAMAPCYDRHAPPNPQCLCPDATDSAGFNAR